MKNYLVKTLNGMAHGLFATLIIGVIFQQIGLLLKFDFLATDLYNTLAKLMGVGIGLGIGLSLKKEGLLLVAFAVCGAISTSILFDYKDQTINSGLTGPGNPLTAYFVVVLTIYLSGLILRKKTPVDIIIVPAIVIIISVLLTLVLSYPLNLVTTAISGGIESATDFSPILMAIVISVTMGAILTSPISSAAVSFAVGLNGIAAGAAVVGTSIQMIGFAIQSRRDNKFGVLVSIAIGTSMLQFKNIVKKPIIWLPTLLSSAIVAPILLVFDFRSNAAGAGMGTSGLVGPLQSLQMMSYNWQSYISILIIVVFGGLLVYLFDKILYVKKYIVEGDLRLDDNL